MSLMWLNVLRRGNIAIARFFPVADRSRKVHDFVNTAMPDIEEVGSVPQKKQKWLTYNDKIFPPQTSDELRRPAFVCHSRENIKYNPKKLWYIACLVRGMSVEEAVKQLDFVFKKGALPIKQTILEARDLAVQHHNVEFPSNLWVAESFVGKGHVVKGLRRHARMRVGRVEYKYSHYFVRLEEGPPPKQYYPMPPSDRASLLEKYMQQIRMRRVPNSL